LVDGQKACEADLLFVIVGSDSGVE
jgi:hypothetical protein